MFVQSAIVPPPPSAFAGPAFIPAWPLESADTFGPAPITEPKAKPGNAPLLILSPGQRVDLLTNERARLISEYDRARKITRTGEMALLAEALRNVTHELMRRQLGGR